MKVDYEKLSDIIKFSHRQKLRVISHTLYACACIYRTQKTLVLFVDEDSCHNEVNKEF